MSGEWSSADSSATKVKRAVHWWTFLSIAGADLLTLKLKTVNVQRRDLALSIQAKCGNEIILSYLAYRTIESIIMPVWQFGNKELVIQVESQAITGRIHFYVAINIAGVIPLESLQWECWPGARYAIVLKLIDFLLRRVP